MKKAFLICAIVLTVAGCRKEEEPRRKPDAEIPEVKELMTLPDHPSEEDDIFIVANGGIYNENLWKEFLEKTGNGEESRLIIACYTIEGDVIYKLIEYDKTLYTMYCDNSRDSFGVFSEIVDTGKYIYDLDYLSEEEIDGTVATFRNHYGFLSDTFYENREELRDAFEKMRQGEETGLIFIFGDSRRNAK